MGKVYNRRRYQAERRTPLTEPGVRLCSDDTILILLGADRVYSMDGDTHPTTVETILHVSPEFLERYRSSVTCNTVSLDTDDGTT